MLSFSTPWPGVSEDNRPLFFLNGSVRRNGFEYYISIVNESIVTWIKTWFLDADTKMNPNLNYAQMKRGPDGQVGQHTGVL